MKRKDLIKLLEKGGFRFERHGGSHDIFVRASEREEIPRHREINEQLAKAILKRRGLL
ncbi:MAG: type II toxin-antitoxin system HicA family toxin [Lachnospiraceae bacterium]|nr:type II toxin-antitoxin system HicA family toxin [Lachnospiraceae bacterium]